MIYRKGYLTQREFSACFPVSARMADPARFWVSAPDEYRD